MKQDGRGQSQRLIMTIQSGELKTAKFQQQQNEPSYMTLSSKQKLDSIVNNIFYML